MFHIHIPRGPYSNALFTTQDTYGICLSMGTLCRVSHISVHGNSVHPNNAIQLTLYIDSGRGDTSNHETFIVQEVSNKTANAYKNLFILICPGRGLNSDLWHASRHATNWATLVCSIVPSQTRCSYSFVRQD